MTEYYTPFYEWAAQWDELSLPEALVLCRIKYWGNDGCFESNTRLAQMLKLDRRTVIRTIISLHDKNLIKITRPTKYKRYLFFNFANTNLPLFDQKVVSERHQLKNKSSVTETLSSVRESPLVVSESHLINPIDKDKTIKEKIDLISDGMKPNTKMSLTKKNKRKAYLQQQIEKLRVNE